MKEEGKGKMKHIITLLVRRNYSRFCLATQRKTINNVRIASKM
jgi:hypothetical protein